MHFAGRRLASISTALLLLLAYVVADGVTIEQLAELDDEKAASDSVLWKAHYAAQYALAQDLTSEALDSRAATLVEGNHSSAVVAGSDRYSLVLVFRADDAFEGGENGEPQELPWAKFAGGGDYEVLAAPGVASEMAALEGGIEEAVEQVLGDAAAVNVLVTGAGGGAGLAVVGAVWAALHYPSAHVLLESFEPVWPSDDYKFNWTFNQVVDQFYVWPSLSSLASLDKLREEYSLEQVMEKLRVNEAKGVFEDDLDELVEEVRYVLHAATHVPVLVDDVEQLGAPQQGNATQSQAQAEAVAAYSAEMPPQQPDFDSQDWAAQLNASWSAYIAGAGACDPILCKTRLPLQFAAGIYSTVAGSGSPITAAFPAQSVEVHGENSADAVVAWDEATATAWFIFEGSIGAMDWLVDSAILQVDFPVDNDWERLCDDPEVAIGFREQFYELTVDANEDANLLMQLDKLRGDTEPRHIICTGHSLGGAVATITGMWMARQFPKTSVQVVTAGSPAVGDSNFAKCFKQHVGRSYRFVHEGDIVPALPPLPWFEHVAHGLWIHDERVYLEERPEEVQGVEVDLNAADHNSYEYSYYTASSDKVYQPSWHGNEE